MVGNALRICRTADGDVLEADAWPRTIRIDEALAREYARPPDLLDFRCANARGIYRISDAGEDGMLTGELVYEEWFAWNA